MFHRTSGFTSLKAGCRRLQLPDDAALELVRFLQVKRVHDEFVPSTTKSCNMSPGAAMDKLWHFMLLNTDVSRCVHDLVGGVVRHVGTDEDDLDDNAKRMQRLYAMNIMAREGCQPDVRFWADPDTNMSFIYPVKQPDGPPLYVCSDMTAAEQAQLTAHLAKLYSNKQSSVSSSPAAPAAAGDISLHHSPADLNSSRLNQANDANVAGNEPEAAQEPPAERRGCSIKTITVVNVRDGRMFLVDVSESATWSATVAQLKQVAAAELSVPAAQVRLVGIKRSAGRFTVDVLSDFTQVSSGQVVGVLLPNIKPPALPTAPFGVHISTLTGEARPVHIKTEDDATDIAQEPPPKRVKPSLEYITIINVRDNRLLRMTFSDGAQLRSTSVNRIRQQLAAKLSVSAADMQLARLGQSLSGPLELVMLTDSARLSAGDVVRVLLPGVKLLTFPVSAWGVYVKTLTGKTIDLIGKLAPWMLLIELKSQIERSEGIPVEQQRLIFAGRELQDTQRLEQCSIVNHALLHLILRIKGC